MYTMTDEQLIDDFSNIIGKYKTIIETNQILLEEIAGLKSTHAHLVSINTKRAKQHKIYNHLLQLFYKKLNYK